MLTLESIAHILGGKVSGRQVICPTPGHSSRDRGTSIRLAPGAPDGLLIACHNGDWREVAKVKDALRNAGLLPVFDGIRRELTDTEKEAIRKAEAQRRAERLLTETRAAKIAQDQLALAALADPEHPYLARKRIAPERVLQVGMKLLVPMGDADGHLWNLQTIAPDGDKRFLPGGRVKGTFWHCGKANGRLVIGEGMATVAAVRRATGLPVIAAMTAGNLPDVATTIHAKRPDLTLVIAADDDEAGLKAARLASAQTGALIALPGDFTHD